MTSFAAFYILTVAISARLAVRLHRQRRQRIAASVSEDEALLALADFFNDIGEYEFDVDDLAYCDWCGGPCEHTDEALELLSATE